MTKKKTIGYFYQLYRTSLLNTLMNEYGLDFDQLHKTSKHVQKCINFDKEEDLLSPKAQPKVYRIVIEEVTE
jgi:hypothetical protein